MREYTPNTETVREQYTREQPPHVGTVSSKCAEFDRWLEQERAVARSEGQAEALRDAARSMRSHKDPGHWNLRDESDPVNAGQSPDAWLERRADRIENGADDERS